MRGGAVVVALAAGSWGLATVMTGCLGNGDVSSNRSAPTESSSTATIDSHALRPPPLPDLSRVAESVQEQTRERYSALLVTIGDLTKTPVELGDAYGEMGRLFMAAQFAEAAEACLVNAKTLVPNDMRWPYYLAHLYRARGASSQSIASFERVLQLRPDDVATLVWLGEAHLAQGRPDSAEPLFAKALTLQPRTVAALAGLGRAALAKQDYLGAVKHLTEALALNQEAASVHYSLGMAYRQLGQLSNAEAHLRQRGNGEVLPPDPLMKELGEMLRSASAYESLGIRALENGESAGAVTYFRKGLELAPDSPSLRHRLGTALFVTGDARGAREQFEAALRQSPGFAQAHYSLGVLMGSTGRSQEALDHLSAAVKGDPDYVEARFLLADMLRHSGRPEESLRHYAHVLEIDPSVGEARLGQAMILVGFKRYQEARDRLDEAVHIHPDQPELAHALARLLAAAPDDRVRDGRRAVALLQALLARQPVSEMYETMAMAVAELGDYDKAVAWQRQAIGAAKEAGREPHTIEQMSQNLELFERRTPSRVPWREGTMP